MTSLFDNRTRAGWCAACLRPSEVPNSCAERRHAAAREITCDSERISDRNFRKTFRGRKILHSKSREIAPKSMPPVGAELAHDPQRSPTTVPSVGMLRRVRLRAILSGFRIEIFEFFSRPRNFEVGTRRNPCRLVTRSLLTTLRGPQQLCRASACCGA